MPTYENKPNGRTKSVTVVLPAWNEGANLLRLAAALLEAEGISQLVVVDDASTEGTAQAWAASSLARDSRAVFWQNPVRLGLACSVLQGIRLAAGTHVLVRDSDFNHCLADTAALAGASGDLVVASRYAGGAAPVGRANDLLSVALNRFLRFTRGRVSDWTYGYFLVRKELVLDAPQGWIFRGRGEYTLRLFSWLLRSPELQVSEISTRVQDRGAGVSSTRPFRHGLAYLQAIGEKAPPREKRPLREALAAWRKGGIGAGACGHSAPGLRARLALMKVAATGLEGPFVDVGCGNGAFARLAFPGAILDGADGDETFLQGAREQGYRSVVAADLAGDFPPSLAGPYGAVLCLEVVQYLDSETLFCLFRQLHERTAPGGAFLCLFPHRESWWHRVRRRLGLGAEDYVRTHDLPLVIAAALEAGWCAPVGWGSSYGSESVQKLVEFHRAPAHFAHLALRFSRP